MNTTKTILIGSLCLICLAAAIVPVAADPVSGNAWNTDPEHIAAMQAYVAYAGALGQAQMDGAIGYFGTIGNGAGTSQPFLAQIAVYQHSLISTVNDRWRPDCSCRNTDEFGS